MKAQSWICNEDDARPAGQPDRCFYCGVALGQEHLPDCVIRNRTVVVELTIKMVRTVPEQWDAHNIEFMMNGGSWCASNIISELEDAFDTDDGPCLCGVMEGRYVAEATEEDEQRCNVFIANAVKKHDAEGERRRNGIPLLEGAMKDEELTAIKQEMINYAHAHNANGYVSIIQECESALELYLALRMLDNSFVGALRVPIGNRLSKDERVYRAGVFTTQKQKE